MKNVFILIRALIYAMLFISLALIYVPASLLTWSGLIRPDSIGVPQITGIIISTAGSALALWSVFVFAIVGRGTPAPFDPPRRLVIQGPYRFVRNPMYIGAGSALAGVTLFYESLPTLGYAFLFFLAAHFFAVWYEEPTLRRTFGQTYVIYCRQVNRWWPNF